MHVLWKLDRWAQSGGMNYLFLHKQYLVKYNEKMFMNINSKKNVKLPGNLRNANWLYIKYVLILIEFLSRAIEKWDE